MWWLMGLLGPKGHEATTFGEFGDKRKKTTLYLQQGSSHNLFKCMCVCTAHLNGLHWKFRLYGSERQRTSNDFASNMSTLVILTAFGLLK